MIPPGLCLRCCQHLPQLVFIRSNLVRWRDDVDNGVAGQMGCKIGKFKGGRRKESLNAL